MNDIMIGHFKMKPELADTIDGIAALGCILLISVGVNWIFQGIYRWLSKRNLRLGRGKWQPYLSKRKLGHRILLLIPAIVFYFLVNLAFGQTGHTVRLLHRIDIAYMILIGIMTCSSILLIFLDAYSKTDKYKSHPLKGLIQGLQVILYFVGFIIIIAVLIDKSPTVLLTGLGASAAVLMLIFKDSILGFVAGVQLSQNRMVQIGDWIQLPDGSANGNVEEITLNTVKVRNWDNTLSMIPPYTLVTAPFKNWRGMQESGGRRADKCIYIDVNSLEICSEDMISDILKTFPILSDYLKTATGSGNPSSPQDPAHQMTNIQIFRAYVTEYIRSHPEVNPALDIIITQKEATPYGLPVEVYFFLKDKAWASFERKQSDIFAHLMAVVNDFGLRLYQRR
ncbi:MAG: mechanosensitive ion channel [Bacteroidales bacterium]|nr:mechanosensitive ion channel [Bacteroidales bacterium]